MTNRYSLCVIASLVFSPLSIAGTLTYQHLIKCVMRDNVCIDYKPTQGPIISNGSKPWFYPEQSKNYGEVSVGTLKTQNFLVANIGTGPLTIYGFDKGTLEDGNMKELLMGTQHDPSSFKFVKSDCPLNMSFVLGPSATCTLSVKYQPSKAQVSGDVLKMLHSSAEVGAIVQDITGTGTPIATDIPGSRGPTTGGAVNTNIPPNPMVSPDKAKTALTLSSQHLQFGDVQLNSTNPALSTILTNKLDESLTFSRKQMNKGWYTFVDNCGATLGPKSSCTFQVSIDTSSMIKPSSEDSLEIAFKEGASVNVQLSGKVMGTAITSIPNPPDAIGLGVDIDNEGYIVLANQGTADAELVDISISNAPEGVVSEGSSSQLAGYSGTRSSDVYSSTSVLKLNEHNCSFLKANNSCKIHFGLKSASEVKEVKYLNFSLENKRYSIPINTKVMDADIKIEPATPDWGIVPFYSSTAKTIKLTNITNQPISNVKLDLPLFYTFNSNTCPKTLGPQESCTASVKFTPTVEDPAYKDRKGVIYNNGDISSIPFMFKGGGTGPVISTSIKELSFGKINPIMGYPSKEIKLTNIGTSPLTLKNISLNNANFKIENSTCSTTIEPDAFCSFSLQLNTSSNGKALSNATIESDSTNTALLTIPVSAEVNGAYLEATPPTIQFGDVKYGSVQKGSIVITNKGNLPIAITDTYPFTDRMSFTTSCLKNTVLNPSDKCQVDFNMPTGVSARDGAYASLTLYTDASKSSFSVSARGIAKGSYMELPNRLEAPLTKVGSYSYATATIYNSGYQPLNLKKVSINSETLNASVWSDPVHNCVNIPYQRSCTVSVKFTPKAYGQYSGEFIFESTDDRYLQGSLPINGEGFDGDIAFHVDGVLAKSFYFGKLYLNEMVSKSIKMTNVGVQTVNVKSVATPWTLQGCKGETLTPGQSCMFTISSNIPYAGGSTSLITDVTTFTFDKAVNATFTSLYYKAGPWPTIQYSSLNFGVTPYNVSKSDYSLISNTGNDTLTVLGHTVENDPFEEVKVDYSRCLAIKPGSTCKVYTTYTSKKEGVLAAKVILKTNSNTLLFSTTKGDVVYSVSASSAAGIPKLSVDLSTNSDTPAVRQLYLANKGSSGLTIQNMSLSIQSGSVVLGDTSTCTAISAGANCVINVTLQGQNIVGNLILNITGGPGDDKKGNVVLPLGINPDVTTLMSNDMLDPAGFYLTSTLWYKDPSSGYTLALADGNVNTYVETKAYTAKGYLYPELGVVLDAPETQSTSKVNLLVENPNNYAVNLDLGHTVGNWYDGNKVPANKIVVLPAYFKGYVSIPINLYFKKDYLHTWYIFGYRIMCECNAKYKPEIIRVYEARVIK